MEKGAAYTRVNTVSTMEQDNQTSTKVTLVLLTTILLSVVSGNWQKSSN